MHSNPTISNSDLIKQIIAQEWQQFQDTRNEGGRAQCQNDFPMFHDMRASQFLTWTHDLLYSYNHDLQEASAQHRNLITEKYAYMMQSTAPEIFKRDLQPYLPALTTERINQQERIIDTQITWACAFMQQYPRLGAGMRALTTAQDNAQTTSFETYLRGELSTYSQQTLDQYEQFVKQLVEQERNLTRECITNTVHFAGFATLEQAEHAQ